jgi:hypothetical protein
VYLADMGTPKSSVPVAVKLLRMNASASDKEEFLAEAELILLLDHTNVIKVSTLSCVMLRCDVIRTYGDCLDCDISAQRFFGNCAG